MAKKSLKNRNVTILSIPEREFWEECKSPTGKRTNNFGWDGNLLLKRVAAWTRRIGESSLKSRPDYHRMRCLKRRRTKKEGALPAWAKDLYISVIPTKQTAFHVLLLADLVESVVGNEADHPKEVFKPRKLRRLIKDDVWTAKMRATA